MDASALAVPAAGCGLRAPMIHRTVSMAPHPGLALAPERMLVAIERCPRTLLVMRRSSLRRATFTWFLGATTLGAERDLGVRVVPLSSAISTTSGQPRRTVQHVRTYAFGLPSSRQGPQALPKQGVRAVLHLPADPYGLTLPRLSHPAHSTQTSPGAHRVVPRSIADPNWNDPDPEDERGGCRERTRPTGSGGW